MWKDLACRQCRVCRYSNNDSLKCACNYCVAGSICHFKFPKVVLARISGEVGTLCTVLLSVYSRTCLPIFIEIGSYLTDTQQKKSWHVFYWDAVCKTDGCQVLRNNVLYKTAAVQTQFALPSMLWCKGKVLPLWLNERITEWKKREKDKRVDERTPAKQPTQVSSPSSSITLRRSVSRL